MNFLCVPEACFLQLSSALAVDIHIVPRRSAANFHNDTQFCYELVCARCFIVSRSPASSQTISYSTSKSLTETVLGKAYSHGLSDKTATAQLTRLKTQTRRRQIKHGGNKQHYVNYNAITMQWERSSVHCLIQVVFARARVHNAFFLVLTMYSICRATVCQQSLCKLCEMTCSYAYALELSLSLLPTHSIHGWNIIYTWKGCVHYRVTSLCTFVNKKTCKWARHVYTRLMLVGIVAHKSGTSTCTRCTHKVCTRSPNFAGICIYIYIYIYSHTLL